MSTTTVTVGTGTVGSYTQVTTSGTVDLVVDGTQGILDVSGSAQSTLVIDIVSVSGTGFLFTDEISGGAYETFNPTSLGIIVPFLEIGFAPGAASAPGFGTLELGNNMATVTAPPPLKFSGTNNELIVDSGVSSSSLGAISGFAYTDTIDLRGVTGVASAVWTQNAGTAGGVLTLESATQTDLADITLSTGSFTSSQFSITTDGFGGSAITVACYRAGTRIATPAGDTPVEALAIGDRVLTADGSHKPIKWLGRRAYSGRFAAGKPHLLPVHFAAGALGNGRPLRPLWVSPQHAMLVDGALIPAICLVNGVSIVQETAVERIEYVHVELDRHDVIFAEGAASETYINDDNRLMFHNAAEYAALYGADAIDHRYCAARIEDGPVLAAIQARLAALAGPVAAEAGQGDLVGWLERVETDRDGTHAVGWAVCPQYASVPVCFELLHRGRVIHRALANLHRPDVEDAGFGSGRCGFRVRLPDGARLEDITVRRVADRAVLSSAAAFAAA